MVSPLYQKPLEKSTTYALWRWNHTIPASNQTGELSAADLVGMDGNRLACVGIARRRSHLLVLDQFARPIQWFSQAATTFASQYSHPHCQGVAVLSFESRLIRRIRQAGAHSV